jgi:hypothetical protein
MAVKFGSLQPQELPFTQWSFLLPFHNRYLKHWGGRRALCTHFNAALGRRPPRAHVFTSCREVTDKAFQETRLHLFQLGDSVEIITQLKEYA